MESSMSMLTGRVAIVIGPRGDSAFPNGPDTLSGDTGEDKNTTPLEVGRQATLLVGSQAVRFSLRSTSTLTNAVATNAPYLAAGARYDWEVETETQYCYVQASDGSTAWQAWVWNSSP